jgi:HEAT repeat protein
VRRLVTTLGAILVLSSGCIAPLGREECRTLRQRALLALKEGTHYEALPSVRAQAVEALQNVAPSEGLPWIRSALSDDHPGVRFAACVALGTLRDRLSQPGIEKCVSDPDPNVQAAAVFALHRLGDLRFSPRLAEFLLNHADPAARRNAAVLLGRLGEPGAIPLLARTMSSDDEALRIQALESMALLGSKEAVQELKFTAYSGDGAQRTIAVLALAQTRDPALEELFRIELKDARHLETKLAAAKALGELRSKAGYALARQALDFNKPTLQDKGDPPEAQIARVRQLAAHALGAIGDAAALPGLRERMNRDEDPRVQLAAALAIVRLTDNLEPSAMPFRRGSAIDKGGESR